MCPDLTEEEMRRALFGPAGDVASTDAAEGHNEAVVSSPSPRKPVAKRKASGSGSLKLVVTLPCASAMSLKARLSCLSMKRTL